MKRDVVLSVILHLAIVVATVISSPLTVRQRQYDDVIKVALVAAPPMTNLPPEPLPPLQTPKAIADEPVEIPIDQPESAPITEIDKPKPEPPPKEEKKPYQPMAETGDVEQTGDTEGASEVEASGGTPFSGTSVDNASFDYPYWFTQAFYKIQSNWRNPIAADYSIVCVVYFQVIKSGRVIEQRIEQSSGVRTYDEACLRAIDKSAPFPPLPREFTDEIIGITLPFKYEP